MHQTVADFLLNEHSNSLQSYGLNLGAFCQLDTPKRHAVAATVSVARSKRDKAEIGVVCDLVTRRGDGVPLSELLRGSASKISQSLLKRIEDPGLWAGKEYRSLLKLSESSNARLVLQHKETFKRSDIPLLEGLTEVWRRSKIVCLVDDPRQVRALISLGEAIRFTSGADKEKAFSVALGRAGTLHGISDRFWRILYRDQFSPKMPSEQTMKFQRIISEKQCRALARAGHCFGELEMIETVFSSESLFYSWSGAKDAVVELIRDAGPFGWYVGEVCRPKAKSLTRPQMKSLENDLKQLEAPVSSFQWSRKVHSAFRVLGE